MRKVLITLTLLFAFVLGLSLVAADETQPEPGSPEDNACYPGGVLYRKENQDGCPSLWHWKAGWFLARFLRGEITRQDFPKEFASVLPPCRRWPKPLRRLSPSAIPSILWPQIPMVCCSPVFSAPVLITPASTPIIIKYQAILFKWTSFSSPLVLARRPTMDMGSQLR
jgi:hypothetical protein